MDYLLDFGKMSFKYIEFDYVHETDWTAKATFDGYEYNVVESYVDGLKNHVYEFAVLKVKDKLSLRKLFNILSNDPSVDELVKFKPMNKGYPKRIGIVIKSRLSNSTRYKARLFDGIEVKDYITNGVENWGFLFPVNVNLDLLFNGLKINGKIINVRSRNVNINDVLSLVISNKITSVLTKAELDTLYKVYKLGFFNEPREASLRTLAKELDLSTSTISHQLRSSIRKILNAIFSNNEYI
ncbi:helix-turn-helix domain-containing protein [Caldivirga maquilingensis]|uniref:Bacterio-opsin activator HTH domain protein n=1 Tax=Caldivirga maquilingensis (strain ATCC 700844 / DSM 13496 / JCM 10307 / IC-167) TaxID=397948 RepID=A8MCV8_CALMQ|nr:helix-turn-helix domain-containing protein [Caldivirga maquilingensis]ABW01614.1 Bacterio-opsin activator HTH domain protein [Caldivirga maquilingensis IC-167]